MNCFIMILLHDWADLLLMKLYNLNRKIDWIAWAKIRRCLILEMWFSTTIWSWPIASTTMIMLNQPSSKRTRRVILLISGSKLLRSLGSTKRNPLLEDTKMSTIMSSIGMPSLRLIKKKRIINFATPDKLKLMSGSRNQPRLKDKWEVRWRRKDFLLIQELIN